MSFTKNNFKTLQKTRFELSPELITSQQLIITKHKGTTPEKKIKQATFLHYNK